ncbi:MAG: hypothetical protein CSYNP_02035 [Syntrophus sp. SKADARSKE-3]|nr:hypothetical protein [Syntrophus sp. SKADARSKE-3]
MKYLIKTGKFQIALLVGWTAIILISTAFNVNESWQDSIEDAQIEASASYNADLAYRTWVTRTGGLYASVDKVPPNPYLEVPSRDIETTTGKRLTMINSAYMARMVAATEEKTASTVIKKLISLKPIHPSHTPDTFERIALLAFEKGDQRKFEMTTIQDQPYLRVIRPIVTEQACLPCHGRQGYRVGDILGGISISIPIRHDTAIWGSSTGAILMTHMLIWLAGSAGIVIGSRKSFAQQRTITENEWKLRTIADSISDWLFWLNKENKISFITPSCKEITGYDAGEFLTDNELVSRIVYPADQALWKKHTDDFETPEHFGLELRIMTKDGEIKWLSHICDPIHVDGHFLGRCCSFRDITHHKEKEEAIKKSEARLKEAQRIAHIGNWELGLIQNRLTWSDEMYRIFERPIDSIGASYNAFIEAIHPDDRIIVDRTYKDSVELKRPYEIIHRLLMADGRIKYLQEMCRTFYDENGKPVRSVGTAQDITEQRKAADQISKQLNRLGALRAIDMAITASLDLRVTLSVVIDHVAEQLHVDAVALLIREPHGHVFEYAAGKGFRSDDVKYSHARVGQGFAGHVAYNRKSLAINDLSDEKEINDRPSFLIKEGFQSYFGAPLIAKGGVIGILELFHRCPLHPDREWWEFFEALAGQAAIAVDNAKLFNELQHSNDGLVMAYDSTLEGWSRALDYRDQETEGHSRRVTDMSIAMARKMGQSEEDVVQIRRGALLHDIGKLGVPDSILLKPGKLTDEEWMIMKQHPQIAYNILYPIAFLRPVINIPYCHHEKWDGSGYPRGLKGEEIPLTARIFAVVDVWDALRSDRPYRKAWPEEKVKEYIRDHIGLDFDEQVADVFLRHVDTMVAYKR